MVLQFNLLIYYDNHAGFDINFYVLEILVSNLHQYHKQNSITTFSQQILIKLPHINFQNLYI